MSEIRTTAYAEAYKYPFALTTLKDYLGISTTNHDTMLGIMAEAATELVEKFTRHALVKKTYTVTLENLGEQVYVLPRGPFVSITTVKGQDQDGTLTALALNTGYYLRGDSFKTIEFLDTYDMYVIEMTAGYAFGSCPPLLQAAIMKQVAFDSENRTGGAITDEVYKLITPFIVFNA